MAFELPLVDVDGTTWLPGADPDQRWFASGFHQQEIAILDDPTALIAASAVQHPEDRAMVLAALAPHLQPDVQRVAFEAIRDLAAVTASEDRINLLLPLLEARQGNRDHADLYDAAIRASLDLIPLVSAWHRGGIVGQLASVVPDPVIETLLQVALSITEDQWRWSVLRDLAYRLNRDPCGRAWEAVTHIDEPWRGFTRTPSRNGCWNCWWRQNDDGPRTWARAVVCQSAWAGLTDHRRRRGRVPNRHSGRWWSRCAQRTHRPEPPHPAR